MKVSSMSRKVGIAGAVAVTALACGALGAAPASAAPAAPHKTALGGVTTGSAAGDNQINDEILAYQAAHPDDLAGLEKLVHKYTGKYLTVQLNADGSTSPTGKQMTGAKAQPLIDAAKKKIDSQVSAMGGIPAYTVQVYTTPLMGPPPTVRVTGHWDFPDSWAGQAAPVDVASIGMSNVQTCTHQSNFTATSTSATGVATNSLVWLENANIGSSAPIWDVNDYESGFVSQADHGTVSVTLANYCGATQSLAATFNYAANQGGSVTSVSASFGLLSVGYSSPGLTRNEGTAPIYFSN